MIGTVDRHAGRAKSEAVRRVTDAEKGRSPLTAPRRRVVLVGGVAVVAAAGDDDEEAEAGPGRRMRRKRRRGAAVMRFIECGDAIRRKRWLER
jgi:hypothetical protein